MLNVQMCFYLRLFKNTVVYTERSVLQVCRVTVTLQSEFPTLQ